VYASDDALVAITEMAYYQALEWRDRIGGGRIGTPIPLLRPTPPTYPLISSHLLWAFTLNASPLVVDVDDPNAYITFQHAPIEILNPGQAYETTQALADRIRTFTDPHQAQTQHSCHQGQSSLSQPDVLDGSLVSIPYGVRGEVLVDLQAFLALMS
jgi:hypothetical protein